MGNKKIVFVHGYTSSPNKTKYRIIAAEFDKLGIEYSIPAMPGNEHPHSEEWLEIIDKEVKNSNKPVVLVGHSLGTRAILLYLDKFEQKIDTVILFASFNNDIEGNRNRRDGNYVDFWEYKLDIDKIKNLVDKFIVIHSKDDDSINYQQAVDISRELGAKLITYENMLHFGGEERAEEYAKIFLEIIKSTL